mmetsp:Transcript_13170/g.38032  ORF Transcript_13170/g.38032 Transcript_13170/m.38032 type:complete len:298 (-) Transcript_13170:870-1763(-)
MLYLCMLRRIVLCCCCIAFLTHVFFCRISIHEYFSMVAYLFLHTITVPLLFTCIKRNPLYTYSQCTIHMPFIINISQCTPMSRECTASSRTTASESAGFFLHRDWCWHIGIIVSLSTNKSPSHHSIIVNQYLSHHVCLVGEHSDCTAVLNPSMTLSNGDVEDDELATAAPLLDRLPSGTFSLFVMLPSPHGFHDNVVSSHSSLKTSMMILRFSGVSYGGKKLGSKRFVMFSRSVNSQMPLEYFSSCSLPNTGVSFKPTFNPSLAEAASSMLGMNWVSGLTALPAFMYPTVLASMPVF